MVVTSDTFSIAAFAALVVTFQNKSVIMNYKIPFPHSFWQRFIRSVVRSSPLHGEGRSFKSGMK